jgi:hypothetical protein
LAGRRRVLNAMNDCLLHPEKYMQSISGFISLIKVTDGMAFAHDNGGYNNQMRSANFAKIKQSIMPTKDEEAIRTPRTPMHLARTCGGETDLEKDIVVVSTNATGVFSGKARFVMFSSFQRFTNLISQFDSETDPVKKNKLREKLKFYNIPEETSERRSIDFYAQAYETSFEKLGTKNGKSVPLVAGPSFSMAKMFGMVYDLGLLNKDGVLNLEEAQILFNCFFPYYIYCGHHSFREVHEPYQRFIDFLVIEVQEGRAYMSILLTIMQNDQPYFLNPYAAERQLPYGKVDDYKSCLHPTYEDRVMARAEYYFEHKYPLDFDDRNTSCSSTQYDYK